MIELLFIVVPCTIVGVGITLLAGRLGWLPTHEGFGSTARTRLPSPTPPPTPPSPGRSILDRRSPPPTPPLPGRSILDRASATPPPTPPPGRSILDRRSAWAPRESYMGSSWSGFRTGGVVAIVVMGLWVLFWIVLLFVGLHLIFTAA